MKIKNDLEGRKFGRLIALERVGRSPHRHSIWKCRCECGHLVDVLRPNLLGGISTSCGCYQRQWTRQKHTTHGMTRTRTYVSWACMIQRCTNPAVSNYKHYGGRGVTVCSRWLTSFEDFIEDMGMRPLGKSLDRVDPEGGYSKENCRWATQSEQVRNRRRNRA